MSKELWLDTGPHKLALSSYWGRSIKGKCIQITGWNCDRGYGYVGMTLAEAESLVKKLTEVLEGLNE